MIGSRWIIQRKLVWIIDPIQWTVIHNFMDHQFQLEDGKLLCR